MWRKYTFRALRRVCSSSKAACFSLSSTLVKDMLVLAREETALERVLALSQGTSAKHWLNITTENKFIKHVTHNNNCIFYAFTSLTFSKLWRINSFSICVIGRSESDCERMNETHLLAGVESLTFFPSKEAKCCSRASNRLLGALYECKSVSFKHCKIVNIRRLLYNEACKVVAKSTQTELLTNTEMER